MDNHLNLSCQACTHTGQVRKNNEDSLHADPVTGVFLVADGMGGHAAGEIASAIAVETVSKALGSLVARPDPPPTSQETRRAMGEAFHQAGREIYERSRTINPSLGMGTTLTALTFVGSSYLVGHVGDSRAYLFRDDRLTRLTTDHSYVQELVDRGMLTPQQAREHPQRNIITRSLGNEVYVGPDFYEGQAKAGDLYLLCSDGLNSMVEEQAIRDTLAAYRDNLGEACVALVDAANEAGGLDNTTVVVVRALS